MADPLKDKQIVLGVCGGIAAYKAVDFLRVLVKCGAHVRVIMTESAQAFVGPLTFEALSGNPVWTHMFGRSEDTPIRHIAWAEEADAVVIVPATANIIGKVAHGIADDPLATFFLAVRAPILICPSMNVRMYENRAVQDNITRLERAGINVLSPETGSLACGHEGAGRLPDVQVIAEQLRWLLCPQDLSGERILITAGPTREPIDPVRFISNPSTGKMGYALARTARRRGAQVLLISGPTELPDPQGVRVIRVRTAEEMFHAVMEHVEQTTIVIKAAAVSDWRPASLFEHKVKKDAMAQHLPLKQTSDILKALGENKKDQILVGFAAETENLRENACAKLAAKNLDLIVANLVGQDDSGFGSDTNQVSLFYRDGGNEDLPLMDKGAVADILFDRVLQIKRNRLMPDA
ncbi:MAG: bifunctional phosphopantothenoylcysteine decarboxylase/phosphopantothenate--cysteine ligase CoaBC [Deltaproteobacteria bacterium]|nr:bifunctional phosphopantothenoylcysteine decarboxylase/phosphopantothenate--cysteine ligase CoaBC [Deltaproteobacteria bacterium]MBW2019639.1 bifunctional phosphopantothenoylcysteine decarboxylase/phosphopantothenate--cysteine ligase CoaBC [Deltaproteobacteria bacterium]MBW2074173.1 bifunctional phosphopantothenoylcysteine decarboxylase/phosphopantothenate--cysteine ligase CoaBC [Deltaproteobacteria bacterium]RLB81149.1 MAG: bifunctional phosphopantothenoylcysteine decarboxylase/phosphopantot